MPEAVIVSTARSPIGRAFKGSLKDIRPDDLAATIVRAALDKVPALDPRDIDDLMLGCGLPGGEQGYNMGRVVAVNAGLRLPARHDDHPLLLLVAADDPDGASTPSRPARATPSSRPASRRSAASSRATATSLPDDAEPESSPRRRRAPPKPPRAAPTPGATRARTASCPTSTSRWARPPRTSPGSRASAAQEMDEFAARSQNLAEKAIANGFWEREITPVTTPDGTVVSTDDGPRPGVTVEGMAGLKPVFRPDGLITAGNACPLNDGAAAVIVMSDTKAKELGLTPLARIVSTAVTGLSPEIMGYGPVEAIELGAARGPARPSTTSTCSRSTRRSPRRSSRPTRTLGIPLDKLNVHGGAIAARPPVRHDRRPHHRHAASTACRRTDKTFGVESMCVGGGMGMAMVIERLS